MHLVYFLLLQREEVFSLVVLHNSPVVTYVLPVCTPVIHGPGYRYMYTNVPKKSLITCSVYHLIAVLAVFSP